MGEPQRRLNPKVESRVNKILLSQAISFLLSIVMLLPVKERGNKHYDYRFIIALCILRILLRKTYADYEIEMRTDSRICRAFGMNLLPGKSTIQRGMEMMSMSLLRQLNLLILKDIVRNRLDIIVDASGIRILARSVWFSIRMKLTISKRECDKVHLAVCADLLLILNWRITNGKKHDSPFFVVLLKPFRWLGAVMADKGYLSRKNIQFVSDRRGQAFIPFKEGKKRPCTDSPKSYPAWKFAFHFWKALNGIYMSIYHRRSRIEAVFSALKKRYGDKLNCNSASMRRKEMSLRIIAYNIRVLLYAQYAEEHHLPLYVRIEKH